MIRLICLLLLPLVVGLPGGAKTQAAAQKRGQRVVVKSAAARQRVSPRRFRRRRKSESIATAARSLREPRRAEAVVAGEDIRGRMSWFVSKRAYPFERIPLEARRRAWATRPKSNQAGVGTRAATQQVWTPIGPAPTVSRSPFQTDWGGTSGRINAVAVSPANPQLILVGASTGGIWRSEDGGAHFVPVSDGQVDLAVSWITFAPGNPAIVYAGMGDIDYGYLGSGVLDSTNGGQTWARVSNATLPDGITARLEVDPANPARVYLAQFITTDRSTNLRAARGFFISTDGGVNWTKTLTGQTRDLILHPTDSRTLYVAVAAMSGFVPNDSNASGLFRSTDSGHTWTHLPVPVNPNIFYGTYYSAWVNRYKVGANGSVSFDKEIGNFSTWGEGTSNARIPFYPLFTGNEADQTLYFGTWRLFKSVNLGDTWFAPAPETDLTKGERDLLSAIAVARSDTNVVYTGSAQGRAMISTDGGSNWSDITTGLPNRFIERIVVDRANPTLAYLAVSGYGSGHVFKTTNAGQTRTDVSGNLPNVPTSAVLIDPLNSQTI